MIRLRPRGQSEIALRHKAAHAFAQAFGQGSAKVRAIGTDCVDLTAGLFASAWEALDHRDCVMGPAADGGYYLIGLKTPQPSVFENIAGSTSSVYGQTLARLEAGGLTAAVLPVLSGIDDERDWLAAASRFQMG